MRKRLTLTAVVAALVACSAALVAAPHETRAAFPGENGRIAFSADADGGYISQADDVWAMDPDGTDLVNLTREQPCCNSQPDWSPDGTKVAFASTRDGQLEIYVMDADGSDPVRITSDPAGDYSPAWSPDGTKIAFVTVREDDPSTSFSENDIYVANADGSGEPTNLTDGAEYDTRSPAWSPDGTKIAFVARVRNPSDWCWNWEIFAASADGSGTPERITRVAEGDPDCEGIFAASPDWSPDGTKIAYSSGARYAGSDIYVIGADGSGERLVASINTGEATPSFAPDGQPSWSPDGSQIAYWQFGPSAEAQEIFAVNANGSGAPRSLTNPQGCYGCQEFNAWAPDWGTAPPIAAPDTTAPMVKSTFPAAGATGVAPSVNVTATFTEAMDASTTDGDPSTINGTTFKLMKAGTTTAIGAVVSYNATAKKAILNPNANLQLGTKYKAVVTTGVQDLAGNRLDQNPTTAGLQQKAWTFTIRN